MTPTIRRILAPIDFSTPSDRAVEYAAALARALGASVRLLHVLEYPFATQGPWDFYVPENPEQYERRRQETETKMAAIAAGFIDPPTKVKTEIRMGKAKEQIVAAALELGADLIVMGTHGRTGLSHVMYGSVAEHVIRKAPCPVLAVCEPGIDYRPEVHQPASSLRQELHR
jgi:universal stress protein A